LEGRPNAAPINAGKPVTTVALGAVSSLSDEERYRKQAEDCRQMAAKVISPLDKEAWLT
jgi:hypothetical protein